MKKIIAILLLVIASLTLTSCGNSKKQIEKYVSMCKEDYFHNTADRIITITVSENENYIDETIKDSIVVKIYGSKVFMWYICKDNKIYCVYNTFLMDSDLTFEYPINSKQGGTN